MTIDYNANDFEYPSVNNYMAMVDQANFMQSDRRMEVYVVDISLFYKMFFKHFKTKYHGPIVGQLALDTFIFMYESALPDYPDSRWSIDDFSTRLHSFLASRYTAYYQNSGVKGCKGYSTPEASHEISVFLDMIASDVTTDKPSFENTIDGVLLDIVYNTIHYVHEQISIYVPPEEMVLIAAVDVTGACLENPLNTNLVGTEYSLKTSVVPVFKEW